MSGGGGKGGSKTTETTIPDWIKDPAVRNLQRAEDVQRIEYMPYYGADVAAFNPMQNAAMNNNIATAQAFGLLDPNSTLTAESGMPTPTDFDGFSGYSSQPMYESALAEMKAKQPDASAQYDALFGAPAMAQLNNSRNASRNNGGGVSFNMGGGNNRGNAPLNTPNLVLRDKNGTVMNSPAPATTINYNPSSTPVGNAPLNNQPTFNFKTPKTYSSRLDSKGYTPKK